MQLNYFFYFLHLDKRLYHFSPCDKRCHNTITVQKLLFLLFRQTKRIFSWFQHQICCSELQGLITILPYHHIWSQCTLSQIQISFPKHTLTPIHRFASVLPQPPPIKPVYYVFDFHRMVRDGNCCITVNESLRRKK